MQRPRFILETAVLLAAALAVGAGCASHPNTCKSAQAGQAAPLRPIRIVLVGDSTVAICPPENPDMGWGQVFGERLTGPVDVIDLAEGGQSSKSFLASPLWKEALSRRADYIFIQFGHNDEPGHPGRSTDPNSDYRTNLARFVDDARAGGATPILVTPVCRRHIRADGTVINKLRTYAGAMKAVAAEKHVALIDLNAGSEALFRQLGPAGVADLAAGISDGTHFSPKGARAIAGLVAQDIPQACPALTPYIKKP